MKVGRHSRITTHLLFRPNSFSKVCVETPHLKEVSPLCLLHKVNGRYVGEGRRSSRTSRVLYFIECQRHLDAYLTVSFETISLDSRSGGCLLCLSQCLFTLCESNLISHFSCLKNIISGDCAGLLMLSSTWYFIVPLLRYYEAISVDLVTVHFMKDLKKVRTLFSFEIRLSLWYFSVFALFIPLRLPEGRSCYMLDHFEIAYLEKSGPDTLASPQPDVPLYFHTSRKGIAEMPVVLSEPTMLCQGSPSLFQGLILP